MSYKLMNGGGLLRLVDNASIPADPLNRDYQEFLRWDAIPGNTPQAADPVPEVEITIEPLAFIERFTMQEQIAIVTAGLSNVPLQLWLTKAVGASSGIVLNGSRTLAGMQALVAAGLITEQRKNEILTP